MDPYVKPFVCVVVVALESLLLLQLLLCNNKKFVSLLDYKYHGDPLDEGRFTFKCILADK